MIYNCVCRIDVYVLYAVIWQICIHTIKKKKNYIMEYTVSRHGLFFLLLLVLGTELMIMPYRQTNTQSCLCEIDYRRLPVEQSIKKWKSGSKIPHKFNLIYPCQLLTNGGLSHLVVETTCIHLALWHFPR